MFIPSFMGFDKAGFGTPLLLDLYPSAAAAYSVRLLRTAYTGSAIRVRRSSDNTEQDIGFSSGNLDTTALTTFCSGTNGFVTTWYDQSGNANNAAQTTAANQPQIVSSGAVLTVNSKPSLKFDGINDGLTTTLSGNTTNLSLNKVEKWNSIAGGQISSNFTDQIYFQWNEIANNWSNYTAAQGRGNTSANTNQTLFSFYDGNGFYQNNSLTRATVTFSGAFTQFTMGFYTSGTLVANVNIQEMIVWTSQQASNRTGISSNINTYYAIY
jgi:hypothetical protein